MWTKRIAVFSALNEAVAETRRSGENDLVEGKGGAGVDVVHKTSPRPGRHDESVDIHVGAVTYIVKTVGVQMVPGVLDYEAIMQREQQEGSSAEEADGFRSAKAVLTNADAQQNWEWRSWRREDPEPAVMGGGARPEPVMTR